VTSGPVDLTVRHNTAFTVRTGTAGFSENRPAATRFDFRDNIVSRGANGFAGTGTGEGARTLGAYYVGYTFLGNAIIGGETANYPALNFFPPHIDAVGFVDFAGANYRLAPSSPLRNAASDGKDVGADIEAVEAAINASGAVRRIAR
jgi:hypothetical protein